MKQISKWQRLAIFLSVLWQIVAVIIAADSKGGVAAYFFFGIAPVVLTWGIWWVYAGFDPKCGLRCKTICANIKESLEPKFVFKVVIGIIIFSIAYASYSSWIEQQKIEAERQANQKQQLEVRKKEVELRIAEERRKQEEIERQNQINLWFEKGQKYYSAKKYTEAIAALSRVIDYDANLEKAYNLRGQAYLVIRDYSHGIADFTKLIELNPQSSWPYLYRAFAWQQSGNALDGLRDYNKAIELNPSFGDAYYYRAQVYASLKNGQQTELDLQSAARLGNENAQKVLRQYNITW
ncbi:MAG: tetratricopeptide repeat protein [Nitrospiraceae bacterium]|nr:tetratricopeptide repeat protein [Nitrospiraceae bacterium]